MGILTLHQFQTIPMHDLYDIFSLWSSAFESIVRLETTFAEHLSMKHDDWVKWNHQYFVESSVEFTNWARQLHNSNFLEQ
jgi:hypothetical protein